MADPNTVRVLSFDGGGERAYFSICWFQSFVQLWGINPNNVWQYFDAIGGTSSGGLIALALASGMSTTDLLPFFTEEAPWIFTIRTAADVASGSPNASLPSNRPNLAQKLAILGLNDQFYTAVDPVLSNYGTTYFQSVLNDTFGTATMQDLKCPVIIPSYQSDTNTFVLFSNVNQPGLIGQNYNLVDVARSTSAAPYYLPPYEFGGHVYMDGGLYLNNSATFARTYAQMIKPTANRACVLSIGTGLGELGFDPGNPSLRLERSGLLKKSLYQVGLDPLDNAAIIFHALLAGSQEAVSQQLWLESQYTLNKTYYYRFQVPLDQTLNTELDNTDPEFLDYLQTTAVSEFTGDLENISTFLGHLTA